jgi:hypothetical protein
MQQVTPLVNSAQPGALQQAKALVSGDRRKEETRARLQQKVQENFAKRAAAQGRDDLVPKGARGDAVPPRKPAERPSEEPDEEKKGGKGWNPISFVKDVVTDVPKRIGRDVLKVLDTSEKAGGSLWSVASGLPGAERKPIKDKDGNVVGYYRDPGLFDYPGNIARTAGKLFTDPGEVLTGREEYLANPENSAGWNTLARAAPDPLNFIGPAAISKLGLRSAMGTSRGASIVGNLLENPRYTAGLGVLGASAGSELSERQEFGPAATLGATLGGGLLGASVPGVTRAARNAGLEGIRARANEMVGDLTPVMAAARRQGIEPLTEYQTRRARLHVGRGADYRFWYERGSKAIRLASGGDPDAGTEQAILFAFGSPQQTTTGQATGFMRTNTQRQAGEPIEGLHRFSQFDRAAQQHIELYRRDPQAFIDEVANNVANPFEVAGKAKTPKLGSFFLDLVDEVNPELSTAIRAKSGAGATVDVWISRLYGYGDHPTPAQRQLMQQDIHKIAQDLGWHPKQVQAAQWISFMSQWQRKAITEAGADYFQSLGRHTATMASELLPPEVRASLDGWDELAPEVQADLLTSLGTLHLDDDGLDRVARRMGNIRLGQFDDGAETLGVGPIASEVHLVDPAQRQKLDDIAAVTAHWRGGKAVVWSRFFPSAPVWMSNGVDLNLGASLDPPSRDALQQALGDAYVVTPNERGTVIWAIPNERDLLVAARTEVDTPKQRAAKIKMKSVIRESVPEAEREALAKINAKRREIMEATFRETFPGVLSKRTPATVAVDGKRVTDDGVEEILRRDEQAKPSKPGAPTLREITDDLRGRSGVVLDQFSAEHGIGSYRGVEPLAGGTEGTGGGVRPEVPQKPGFVPYASSLDAAPEGLGAALRKAFGGTPLRTATQTAGGAAYGALNPEEGQSRAESALLAGGTALGTGLGVRAATARSVGSAAQRAAEDVPAAEVAIRRGRAPENDRFGRPSEEFPRGPENLPRTVMREGYIAEKRDPIAGWSEPEEDFDGLIVYKALNADQQVIGEPLRTADPSMPRQSMRGTGMRRGPAGAAVFNDPERGDWGAMTGRYDGTRYERAEWMQRGFATRADAEWALKKRRETPMPDVEGRIWFHGTTEEHGGVDPEFGLWGTTQFPGAYHSSHPELAHEYGGSTGYLYATELDVKPGNVLDLPGYVRPSDPINGVEGEVSWEHVKQDIVQRLYAAGVATGIDPRQVDDTVGRAFEMEQAPTAWQTSKGPALPGEFWPRDHSDRRNPFSHARASGRHVLSDGTMYAASYQYRDALGIALYELGAVLRSTHGGASPVARGYWDYLASERGIFGGVAPDGSGRSAAWAPKDDAQVIKAYLAETMRGYDFQVVYHVSPGADGEVAIVLDGDIGAHPVITKGINPKDVPDGADVEFLSQHADIKEFREYAIKEAEKLDQIRGIEEEIAKPGIWLVRKPDEPQTYVHWMGQGTFSEVYSDPSMTDRAIYAEVWAGGKDYWSKEYSVTKPKAEIRAEVEAEAKKAAEAYLEEFKARPVEMPEDKVVYSATAEAEELAGLRAVWNDILNVFQPGDDIPRLGMVDGARARRLASKGLNPDKLKQQIEGNPEGPLADAAEAAVRAAEKPTFIRMLPSEMAEVLGLDDVMVKRLRDLDRRKAQGLLSPAESRERTQAGQMLTELYGETNNGRSPNWVLAPDARTKRYQQYAERRAKMLATPEAKRGGASPEEWQRYVEESVPEGSQTLAHYLSAADREDMMALEKIASSPTSTPEMKESARRVQFERRGVPLPTDRPITMPPEAMAELSAPPKKPSAKETLAEKVRRKFNEGLAEEGGPQSQFGRGPARRRPGPSEMGAQQPVLEGWEGGHGAPEEIAAGPSAYERSMNVLADILNLPRSLIAAGDVSNGLRQALLFAFINPKGYGQAAKAAYNAMKSEQNADAIMTAIQNGPRAKLAEKYLEFTEWKPGKSGTSLTKREENYASNWVSKIPGMRATARANTILLNFLRDSTFNKTLDEWDAAGKVYGPAELEKLGKGIGIISGRGGDIFGAYGPLINGAFFSPRFAASRFQTPWLLTDPVTRKMAAKGLGGMVGLGTTVMAMAALAGADVGYDPRASNWGKVKAGPVSFDFWVGYAPLTRTIARMATGQSVNAAGEAVPSSFTGELGKFLEGKLSPTGGSFLDIFRGESRWGEDPGLSPAYLSDQVWEHTVPLFLQDAFTAATGRAGPGSLVAQGGPSTGLLEGAIAGPVVGASAFVGLGATTYHGPIDDLDNAAEKLSGSDPKYSGSVKFWDLEAADRDRIKKQSPDLWERYVSQGSTAQQRSEEVRGELTEQQRASDNDLKSGKITLQQWQEQLEERAVEQRARLSEVYGERAVGKPKNAVDRWSNAINEAKDPRTGEVDWDAVREWEGLQSAEDRAYIERNTGLGGTGLTRKYADFRAEYYQLSKYRGYTSDQAALIDAVYQEALNRRRREGDKLSMLAYLRTLKDVDPEVIKGARRRVLGLLKESTDREKWRKAHPEAEFIFRRGKLTPKDLEAVGGLVEPEEAAA